MQLIRGLLQQLIIVMARPYIVRELPGWGKLYEGVVGGYRRNELWAGAPIRLIRGKLHGYLMHLDLSRWADRFAFFLARWYALDLQLLMADVIKRGDVVVDIGANRGMFALMAVHLVGKEGRVICFEPNPGCLDILERDIAANGIENIEIQPCALADQVGELTLSIPKINFGEGTLGQTQYPLELTDQISVPVRIGDDLLAGVQPALIKLDVEGFEVRALSGLKSTLSVSSPIVVTEVVPAHLASCASSVAELIDLMTSLDYQAFRLGIRKAGGRYMWTFSPPDREARTGTDWVWIPRKRKPQFGRLIEQHQV
jgi:FkbM family methyltransferase